MDENYTTVAILLTDMEDVNYIAETEGWKKSQVIHNAVQYYKIHWEEAV